MGGSFSMNGRLEINQKGFKEKVGWIDREAEKTMGGGSYSTMTTLHH